VKSSKNHGVGPSGLEKPQQLHVWQESAGVHRLADVAPAKLACPANPQSLETVIAAKVILPRPRTVESVRTSVIVKHALAAQEKRRLAAVAVSQAVGSRAPGPDLVKTWPSKDGRCKVLLQVLCVGDSIV